MKKSYINPNTECIALQGATIMDGFSVSGGGSGDSQSKAHAPQRSV